MLNADENYDNAFQPDNVYGHTLALLQRRRERTVAPTPNDVHLDLGCGFGRIAEPLTAALGLHYIGIDGAPHGVASLVSRGFEAHEMLFETRDDMIARLRQILNGRNVASLTMLDTLEHLTNGDMVLGVIRELIAPTNAPAVISVPNTAHRDIGFKLALGQWDYTSEGLLDHTHVRLFSHGSLRHILNHAGLQVIDENNVRIVKSDQHFPATHPALAEGSVLHQVLDGLRRGVDDHATVNQLVQMVVAGPHSEPKPYVVERAPKRPFMSLITRTQGTRLHCLTELLTCLAAQKDQDFELLVIGHKLTVPQQLGVERTIEDSPKWLRDKTRLVREDEGNRTRPLNRGFQEAQGEYVSIVDDDDIPMAHWVETFRSLAQKKPGAVLRAVAARQTIENVTIRGRDGIRAISALTPYPGEFDFLKHMMWNETPPIALAFPRGVFHDLNLRFDESLTTTEDWDFLLRCISIVGVSNSPEITSVYHWWTDQGQSSRTDHDQNEWDENYRIIQKKLDAIPLLLPAGATRQLRELRSLHNVQPQGSAPLSEGRNYLAEILAIRGSWHWRLTAPLRLPKTLRGRGDPRLEAYAKMTETELIRSLNRLRKSSSWRATALFRPRGKK